MTAWTAIIPVKPWALAKLRLDVSSEHRYALARAFSLDVLRCVVDTPGIGQIIGVTAEPEFQAEARTAGAVTLTDRPLLSSDPLNDAIRLGRSWALVNDPDRPIIVIPADLPSLTIGALAETLGRMSECAASFVVDGDGSGTTLLSAVTPRLLRPAYGTDSAHQHTVAGIEPMRDVDPRVSRDVDTLFDLSCALELGLGVETTLAAGRTIGFGHVDSNYEPEALWAM